MELILFNTKDGENVINKEMIEKYRFNIKMKKDTDLITPTIILNDKGVMNFNNCNYCYIEEFNRYYFIRTVENLANHIWALVMECDVLETYKTDILNVTAVVKRAIHDGDYYVENTKVKVLRDVTIHESDVLLINEPQHILSTIGGV